MVAAIVVAAGVAAASAEWKFRTSSPPPRTYARESPQENQSQQMAMPRIDFLRRSRSQSFLFSCFKLDLKSSR